MPTTDQLQFEMQRRVILFNSGTTMPDNTVLGYEGNPNSANTSTPGQTLLYNSPRGTSYIELVNGNLWYKQQIPNTWINLTSGTVSGTANFSSQNNVVFTTGNQDISGVKNFYSRPTVNGSGVLLIGETGSIALPNTLVYITGNQTISGNKTFDVAPIVSGNKLITGLDLSSYATNATLDNKINSLSGYVNSQSTSGQVFNTGSVLDNKINTLSGYVNSQDNIFSGQTFNTGSRLDNKVNSLSGYVNSQDIIFSGQTASTGSRLDDKINALSGYVNSQDIILSGQVASSGSRLDNKINALSGYVSGISAGGTLPSTIVYITGNQTISGTKTFANNLEVQGTGIFNALDLSNISEFNFSGTNINLINGNVNISGGTLYISGNAVLTGVNLNAYATTANLFATGSTLDNKINSLSGYVNAQSTSGQVFNTGSALDNKINALSGYVNNQDIIFSGQTSNTGSRLDNKINSLSGYINAQDIIFSGQIALTGSNLYNSIVFLSGLFTGYTGSLDANFASDAQLFTTGSTLDNKINSLSGYVNSQDNIFSGQIFNTGSRLDNKINSLSGYLNSQDIIFSGKIALTGSILDNKINTLSGYVNSLSTSGQVFNTGSILDNKINALSGYVNNQDIIFSGQTFSTGSRLDNKINSLSGYTNSQDIIFSGQTASTGSLLDNKINSLSGYVDSKSITLPSTIVYTTGDQLISGNKTFLNNIAVSGTGNFNNVKVSNIDKLFLSGIDIVITGNSSINVYNDIYISGNRVLTGVIPTAQTISNVVYTTGDQLISGNKTFLNNVNISGTGNFNNVKVSSIDNLFLSGIDILITGNSSINVYNAIYISGNPVLTGVIPTTQTITNVVYITGNQAISGTKTFAQTGSFNTLQITNKKLSSYNYINSNFTFGDIYINIVNSSNNIIGTLPSGITSGINYYVKNLNTGILLITGSGQRTIDGFSNINLYKNESLQLLGVNNIGYTGWVTLSADNGVS